MDADDVLLRVFVAVAIGLAGADARADANDADDRNEAARLFDEGHALKEAGDFDAACERFEKSYTLDRASGTALNLGECAEKAREWRRAWELYDAAATMLLSKSDKRARFARDRADRVLADHRDHVEAQPSAMPLPREQPPVQSEKRTGLKLIAGASLGIAAVAGALWIDAFVTYDHYLQGSATGVSGGLYVPRDCGAALVDVFSEAAKRFDAACDAHDRIRVLRPLTIASGVVGGAVLVYLLATDPKPITVAPTVSGTSAGVTATFEW